MTIYQYLVSSRPEYWYSGRRFQSYREAEAFAQDHGLCMTEVAYTFDSAELVTDYREETS